MASPLEITAEDIARLDDTSLRELIGLLCEAEFRKAGRSASCVTWGGNQNASDGGFDVFVEAQEAYAFQEFLRGGCTTFQVKKPAMPPTEIIKEMKPNGILRKRIRELIPKSGSYIIVSSGDSVTRTSLDRRHKAMREAVAGEPDHEGLFLDFLDSSRIATWVREHPSYIIWVRNRIGRQIQGWQPYADWSHAPGGLQEEYLIDDGLRLHDGIRTLDKAEGLSIEQGLLRVRSLLAAPGASVRLAGLSGVGKTRFAIALFDDRVGESAIEPTLAFYTDISDAPEPDPQRFAEWLIADRARAVLIVDAALRSCIIDSRAFGETPPSV